MYRFRVHFISLIVLLGFHFDVVLAEEEKEPEIFSYSLEYELDAYYTNAALFVNLTDKKIPDIGTKNEFEVYSDLASRALLPRFMIVEASIYPMPILGTQIRKHAYEFYQSADIGTESNLIRSITAGFEEPWAMTLFLGNMVKFDKGQDNTNNRGFMGFLLAFGNQHISQNIIYDDNWLELEWKIKGDRIEQDQELSWSFRTGLRFNDHPNISDLWYIAMRRKHVGFNSPLLSWLFNSGYELTLKFNQTTSRPVEQSFFIDKKIPLKGFGVTASFGVGIINTNKGKYSGPLATANDIFTIAVRPSIEF